MYTHTHTHARTHAHTHTHTHTVQTDRVEGQYFEKRNVLSWPVTARLIFSRAYCLTAYQKQ